MAAVNDGSNTTTATVAAGDTASAVAVNPVTNKIYVANQSFAGSQSGETIIDGATNSTNTVTDPFAGPNALAVNAVTNKIYVANLQSNHVTVLTEQQVQPIPLTTAITPLPADQFVNPGTAVFHFTTSSSYTPAAPAVQNVYYQLDTWQGPWLKATGSAPNFSASVPPLPLGVHIIYAYAADGQFADSTQTDKNSSPIPGAIAAYLFVVVLPTTSTSVSLTGGVGDPSLAGQALVFTATVTALSGTPTGTVVFYDFFQTSILTSAAIPLSARSAHWTVGLPVGVNNIVALYSGDTNFGPSTSAPCTHYRMANAALHSPP